MRVLVVEDERAVAEVLSWGLATEGYVVDVAADGVDGLWKATENSYDVIVLDVMLPGLDGYQVCRRLRDKGHWTPVLLRHQGQVISKSELLDHCWDANFDGDPAVVEVLMHRLRRKVAAPGRPRLIETRRGQGYIIASDMT